MPGDEADQSSRDEDEAMPRPSAEVSEYFRRNPGDDTGGVSDIALLRERTRSIGLRVRGRLEAVGTSEDTVVTGVPVRRYTPLRVLRPGLGFVWMHGGGWMHGDLDVYEEVARAFCNELGCEALAVDYGLAPEHPFPHGLDEVWSVVRWASERFPEVVVAGDSSGGNLAAATAIRARDAGVRLAAQVLIYPVLDSSDATAFKQRFRTRYARFAGQEGFGESTHQRIKWIWESYAPDPALRNTPLATPMRAPTLRGIAPAVVVTAEHDILRGEAEAYVERLRADGVAVRLIESPGQIHGFLQMRAVLTDAKTALTSVVSALGGILDSSPVQPAPNRRVQTKES